VKYLMCALVLVVAVVPAVADDPKADDLLKKGLEAAKKADKHVFLVFRAGDPISAAFDKFHDDADVKKTLEKYFIVVPVHVQNNEGGGDLYGKYGGGDRGFPAWTILNKDSKVIGDSGDTGNNVGYPVEESEIEHYFKEFKKACPKLADADVELLTKKFKAIKPDMN
jgi:hypothetical protein